MNIIRFSIHNPVTVFVGILLLLLFGFVSLQTIPVQLSPNVEEPVITVNTVWPGATPYEVERDIIEEQEKVLKGIPGLYEMESTSANSNGSVTLRFTIGSDIEAALLRVSNKLDEVPRYPENVDRPIINASGAESSPVVWIMFTTLEGNGRSIYTYRTYLENELRQFFDRVPGVADLFIGGGIEQEMHVRVRPDDLAAYNLTVDQVINTLRAGNVNISAGNMDVGRRDFRVRTVAEYRSPEDIEEVVLISDGRRVVYVRDVADVELGYAKRTTPVITDGEPGISIGVRAQANTNILDLTDRIEQVVAQLNEERLVEQQLVLTIVSEQRPYIRGAIDLLKQNILIGGTLAVIVLLIFLRHIIPTIVVSTTIPISIIGTFIFLRAAGSTLNVISLAGIAFAVGMLVDNAIVVLENIDRHKKMGKSPTKAAYDGTSEVWGAVLASSLTTIAVFLPVIFLEDEAGQLFKDIAIAVSCAVAISLVAAMTVIPMFSRLLFRWEEQHQARRAAKKRRFRLPAFDPLRRLGNGLQTFFMLFVRLALANWFTRLVTVALLVGSAALLFQALAPKMEYLPQGNRDLIINILVPPPGLSYDERAEIGETLFAKLLPYEHEALGGYPRIERMFYVAPQSFIILGVISADQARTAELIPLCQEAMADIPGVFGISNQASLFQQGLGQGRTIEVNISGTEIDQLVNVAGAMFGMVMQQMEDVQVRPVPSLDLTWPEANFVPVRERLQAVGLSAQQFGVALDVLMDGRDVGDYKREGQKKIDLVVKASEEEIQTPEELRDALMVTGMGEIVPVSSLANLVRDAGLTEIRHLERNRTISLEVSPPYSLTIQETMEHINGQIVPELAEMGMLEDVDISMSGTADKLTETRAVLQWNFLVAAVISYLLMSALLGNFLYPLIIMFTVPLAAAGGMLGLKLVNIFIAPQQLDILTMLGFIILIGIVVNNAILIVYQSLQNIRVGGMEHHDAVLEAVKTRLRPIYMSATTSVFAMLPMVLWPGPGSELYRGLGSVVLGGLAISTIFTVFLIPSLLLFVIRWEKVGSQEEEA